MYINNKISSESWSKISVNEAETYLHYYPKDSKYELSNFISSLNINNPTVVDLGCGNAQLYPILSEVNSNFNYIGVDISDNLLNVAEKIISKNDSLIKADIFEYLLNLNTNYDFLVLCHMIECTESPDLIISEGSRKFDYICIIWYDYPTYEYDSAYLAENPHASSEFRPFIRRKISKNYWEFLISKNNLNLIHQKKFGNNNIFEVYKTKK